MSAQVKLADEKDAALDLQEKSLLASKNELAQKLKEYNLKEERLNSQLTDLETDKNIMELRDKDVNQEIERRSNRLIKNELQIEKLQTRKSIFANKESKSEMLASL